MLKRTLGFAKRMLSRGVKRGEIKNDDLYQLIQKIAARPDIHTILEIGSSTGDGSTEAFVAGMNANSSQPKIFCLEALRDRFEILQNRYGSQSCVHCYNMSSVDVQDYPTEDAVVAFMRTTPTNLPNDPEVVLDWMRSELAYIKENNIQQSGIRTIMQRNAIKSFDVVLIDGSEFTGSQELDVMGRARIVLLDDINAFKNHYNCQRLLHDKEYRLVACNPTLRNGYAVFERTGS